MDSQGIEGYGAGGESKMNGEGCDGVVENEEVGDQDVGEQELADKEVGEYEVGEQEVGEQGVQNVR